MERMQMQKLSIEIAVPPFSVTIDKGMERMKQSESLFFLDAHNPQAWSETPTNIIPPNPVTFPPPDLPDNLPDDPFSPDPKHPVPPLPDLYPTDPPYNPFPETPRLPGDPPTIGE